MKFFSVAITVLMATAVSAQAVRGPKGNCGFPNGPTCVSTGRDARGLETFAEPANSPGPNCCLFPLRCGNRDGGQRCIKGGTPVPGSQRKGGRASRRAVIPTDAISAVEKEE